MQTISKMASTIESMHGILHEVSAKLTNLNASKAQYVPRSASSGRKRSRDDDGPMEDDIPAVPAVLLDDPVTNNASVASIFNGQFKASASGYNPATLSSKSTETFIYDWYAKGLGVVRGSNVELIQRSWMSSVGSKVSTDNQGDAKSLMKLVELLSTKSQLDSLKGPKPDAATDPAYGDWELLVKGICKALTSVTNDFLTMKEGKVGNAKALTVGAMARRWKMQKYPTPTESELQHLRESSSSTQKTSSSSSVKAKSTILKTSSKVKVTV